MTKANLDFQGQLSAMEIGTIDSVFLCSVFIGKQILKGKIQNLSFIQLKICLLIASMLSTLPIVIFINHFLKYALRFACFFLGNNISSVGFTVRLT